MHMYTKCDQNIPCGSRVMNISLTANRQTHFVITVQTQGSCNQRKSVNQRLLVNAINNINSCTGLNKKGLDEREPVFGGLLTTQAQISLRIRAV